MLPEELKQQRASKWRTDSAQPVRTLEDARGFIDADHVAGADAALERDEDCLLHIVGCFPFTDVYLSSRYVWFTNGI